MSDYDFVDNDSEKIYNDIIGQLMQYTREPLYPGDERRIYGEGLVYLFSALYSTFNEKAKQRFLRFARGTFLDAIGEMFGVVRLEPGVASTTIRFETEKPLATSITIPAGTKVTTDGSIYFATDEGAVLSAGETFVDVKASSIEGGVNYNGIAVGQLATLVDLIPYISKVSNTTITAGGDDGEAYDLSGDERFRNRIRNAPAQLTTAGPEASYVYHAMSVDADIIDVALDSPSGNIVNIYVLMAGGESPSEDVLRAVEEACSADDVRPLTDKVTALSPEVDEYDINVHYYCAQENEADVVKAMEGEGGAIEKYRVWQQGALGRAVNPDYLRKLMLVPGDGLTGADRVDIKSPTYKENEKNVVSRFSGNITVTHEVL